MARARNIKPGFFKNEVLAELPYEFRLLFSGLWTLADREGRFEIRERRIKAELFPYDDIDIADGLDALQSRGFLILYSQNGKRFAQVVNWSKHQNPHHKEVASTIPAPTEDHPNSVCNGYVPLNEAMRRRIFERDGEVCAECGATEDLSIDHMIPVSRGGNSTEDNLRVLCMRCNASKGNRLPCISHARVMHEPSMNHARVKQIAPCPTDSLNRIPDSPIDACSEVASQPSEPKQVDKVVLTFPVAGTKGTDWDFCQSLLSELQEAFPALDVLQQVRSALAWVKANPSRKKTPTGMRRFITGWLTKAQNRGDGGNGKPGVRPQSEGRPPVELVKAEDSEAAHRRWLESRKRQGLPTNGPARLGHNLRLIDPPEATP